VGENPLNGNGVLLTGNAEDEDIVYSYKKFVRCVVISKRRNMKKFDKEYFTQYTPEKEFLLQNGINPSFVKVIDGVTTYKYTKTSELFRLLAIFYAQK
jgi:hypothetical protein